MSRISPAIDRVQWLAQNDAVAPQALGQDARGAEARPSSRLIVATEHPASLGYENAQGLVAELLASARCVARASRWGTVKKLGGKKTPRTLLNGFLTRTLCMSFWNRNANAAVNIRILACGTPIAWTTCYIAPSLDRSDAGADAVVGAVAGLAVNHFGAFVAWPIAARYWSNHPMPFLILYARRISQKKR